MSKRTIVFIFLTSAVNWASAQVRADTLRINIDSAEKIFLSGNYTLLAQKYNIQSQKALEIQAKLYPNPNLTLFYSLYNSQTKKFFPVGPDSSGGELTAQLSQLIYLAGKRKKQLKIAETNTRLAEYQFYDLMRTLKYTLRTDFYNIYFLLKNRKAKDILLKKK
jgi:cobalt-zinc-cadmium efflux system outer membrane protein